MASVNVEIDPNSNVSFEQLQELKRIFNEFDKDRSGYITRDEFHRAIKKVKFNRSADHIMLQADADRNEQVSFQEFVDAATYTTNEAGVPTNDFNALIRIVAQTYVKKHDDKTLSYLSHYKWCPPPVFILCFTIVQIVVYVYLESLNCTGPDCPPAFRSDLAFRPGCREEVYRFLTYVFLHANVEHIVFNVILQIIIGIPLEMVHGPLRVCILYILGGLAGAMASSVVDPNTNLVGASAAIYALVGAHVADVFLNWAEMPFRWIRATVLFVLLAIDLSLSIYNRYEKGEDSVSYAGHFAGFITGCTLGTMVLKNLSDHPYERIVGYVGLGIYIAGTIFAIFFNIFYDGYESAKCP